jgi:hypothetical protein
MGNPNKVNASKSSEPAPQLNRLTKNASKRIGSLSFKKTLTPFLQNCPVCLFIRISFEVVCQEIEVWHDFLGGEVIGASRGI